MNKFGPLTFKTEVPLKRKYVNFKYVNILFLYMYMYSFEVIQIYKIFFLTSSVLLKSVKYFWRYEAEKK